MGCGGQMHSRILREDMEEQRQRREEGKYLVRLIRYLISLRYLQALIKQKVCDFSAIRAPPD
jgi:hypothetical protein